MKNLFFLLMSTILMLSGCSPDRNDYIGQTPDDLDFFEVESNRDNKALGYSANNNSSRAMATSNMGERDQTAKIITTANLNMEVVDLAKFESNVSDLLKKYSASVTNQSRNDSDKRLDAYFTIRVPEDKFESLFEALTPYAKKIENQSLNLEDVTEQFIDVGTRLKNRKALEARYRELLKQAKNVNDILNIERQLNQVRSEIESQEGRLKYLSNQVDMSTIQLNAYEVKPYIYEPEGQDNFGQRILKALASGWSALISCVMWFISLWPIVLVVGLIIFIVKRRKA